VVEADLPRSQRALLLVDFINPLDFPGAQDLAPGALKAAVATARALCGPKECRLSMRTITLENGDFNTMSEDWSAV
jgi:hypothetical protein